MLIEISSIELMRLWADLVEAYHGVNGYGGDEAEIYAYRLGEKDRNDCLNDEEYKESQIKARENLFELLELFQEQYDCEFSIYSSISLETIKRHWIKTGNGFNHRTHIKVIKQGDLKNG